VFSPACTFFCRDDDRLSCFSRFVFSPLEKLPTTVAAKAGVKNAFTDAGDVHAKVSYYSLE
jgi:hypothetical protein